MLLFLALSSWPLGGFYTGPPPHVLTLTVFILASLQMCKIQKLWGKTAACGGCERGFCEDLAGGGKAVVDVEVVGQLLFQKGGGKGLAGRMAEDGKPPRDQGGLEGWLQDGWGLPDFGPGQEPHEIALI